MEADFVQNVFVPLTERTYNSRGKMYHRAPDRFLMRFSDPAGDVIVADGRHVWMYYPSTDARQVTRFPLSAEGQQADLYREFLSNATERYVATRTGAETVGGRATQGLSLIPRGSSPYRSVRLWVDDGDSLVRRFEITEENGTVRKIEMSGLRSNVTLADALFQFTPPPGVQVHEF
jgi:outer membrane lipoprotein carrier protein